MSELPYVSVVLPVYNGEATIIDCLDSLLAIEYPPRRYEVVCIDNASTDRTPDLIARYRDRIRVLFEEKRGVSAARNRGLRESTADVVAFADADCVVEASWLSELVTPLFDETVGMVGGTILATDPDNPVARWGERIHNHSDTIGTYRPPYVISMNSAARLPLLRSVGGFDETLLRGEDVDLSYRLVQAGYRFVFVPGAILRHRNESTLRGLMHEGFVHGFYAIPVLKKHRALVAGHGHRRFTGNAFRRAFAAGDRYAFWFDFAKGVGQLCGSVRFGYLEV